MKQLIYKEVYARKSFPDLIQTLGRWEQDNQIVLDAATGTGTIRFFDIEPGLQLRLWDCTFTNGIEIFREGKKDLDNRNFTLVYYLTPSFVLEDCHNSPAAVNPIWDTVLMSSDADFKASILPGKALRCLSFNFTGNWLQKNVGCDAGSHNQLIQRFVTSAGAFSIFESLSATERRITQSFFDNVHQQLFGKFFWRSKTLNLLAEFFAKVAVRLSLQEGAHGYHEEQMAEVEKELVNNIYNGLPDIKTLAKNIAVSESTLKRYFNRIYGKNISGYFLEKRMTCAQKLLIEKKKTVTETAFIMGYENVSHFSNTFKRFFGFLPGKIRRNGFSDPMTQ